MSRNGITALIVSAVFMAVPAFAVANEGTESSTTGVSTSTPDFTELDADSSGYLTEEEVTANGEITESYATIDTNADGRVDRTEFSAFEMQQSTDTSESMPQESDTWQDQTSEETSQDSDY